MSRKESVVRGAAALALAGLFIKIGNLLVRLPLTRMIGSEGLGIYQMALPAYNALLHLAVGGVPVAVQNLVAEYDERGRWDVVHRVLRLALTYSLLAGGAAACLMLAGAPLLARALGDARSYWPLVALAPAVILNGLDSVFRHYLQGQKQMTPSAVASVLEQGTKIVVTMGAAMLLLPLGLEYAAAGAALGITAGALASVLFMLWRLGRERAAEEAGTPVSGGAGPAATGAGRRAGTPKTGRLRRVEGADPAGAPRRLGLRMLRLAWPVTLGSVSMPLLNVLDVSIVQRGFLRAGYPPAQATALYGAFAGIAVQVVWFPFVLTNAVANAIVPTLTAAQARGDRPGVQQRVLIGLRTASLICLPVAIGAMVLATPIALLFGEPLAADPLRHLGPVALLGPLTWMTVAQLQALGETGVPMRNLTLAMGLKLALDALLAPIRGLDVNGVALASVAMFLTAFWLNARELERLLDEPLPWGRILTGPMVASLVMGMGLAGMTAALWGTAGRVEALAMALVVAPVLYGGTLIATRSITRTELLAMAGPFAPRLERWLAMLWPWS